MKLKKHLAQGNIIYFCSNEQQLSVAENEHYRWLCLNNTVQSVMLKRKPWQLILPHQLAMALPLLLFTPQNVLEFGLGGGALSRYIKHRLPQCSLTTVELSAEVITCFERFFKPQESSTHIINSDAELWLKAQAALNFDWIVMDIFLSIEDSVISYHLIDTLLNQAQQPSIITLNLPNEKEQQINTLLQKLKLTPNIDIIYFTIPHYKNIVIHILPLAKKSNTLTYQHSSLPKHQQIRWRKLWQQGVKL